MGRIFVFAPKGRTIPAQGNALGKGGSPQASPEGAYYPAIGERR